MTASRHTSERIVIVGGGISGLSIACRLALVGLPVTVLEASRLGAGASTRNQGWLHGGGWFALRHPQLARMCYESAQQTIGFCPDCLEPHQAGMAFIVSQAESEAERWTRAWQDAAIPFEQWPLKDLFQRIPHLNSDSAIAAFRLPDRAFRPAILVTHMAEKAEAAGAEIRCETPVSGLVLKGDCVTGVTAASGERLLARVVILAGNAAGADLWLANGNRTAGAQSEFTRVFLKTHLQSVEPGISRLPFCVVDADGLNHIPHGRTSVFGTDRWNVVAARSDQRVDAAEVVALTEGIGRLFPKLELARRTTSAWAGTTVQAMHVEQVIPGDCPLPTVIDHELESPSVRNLFSVFPGRATLWPQLAELTRIAVLDKLESKHKPIARPPWECVLS